MKPDVFLSYGSDTKSYAEEIARLLEREGMQPWLDFKDIRPGQRWQEQIEIAATLSKWFVVVVGSESKRSNWLDFEWQALLKSVWDDQSKRVLPVVVGSGTAPGFLRNWVALHVDPVAEPHTWAEQVLHAMKASGDKGPGEPSPDAALERRDRFNQMHQAIVEKLAEEQPAEFTSGLKP